MTCSEKDLNHQYQLDLEGLAGKPDRKWAKYEAHDGGSPLGLHDVTLFDQDETQSGDTYDLATGRKIDNSTSHALGELVIDPLGGLDYDQDDPLIAAATNEMGEFDENLFIYLQEQRDLKAGDDEDIPEA